MTMTDYRKEFEKVLSGQRQRQQAASKPETKNRKGKGSFWQGSKPEKRAKLAEKKT